MVQDPKEWSKEKFHSVEQNLNGMRRKLKETGDPNLSKGIQKVEEQLREAKAAHPGW
jgi:hypothetical protein